MTTIHNHNTDTQDMLQSIVNMTVIAGLHKGSSFTLGPSQPTWFASPLIGCYHLSPLLPFICYVLLGPKADAYFFSLQRVHVKG